VAKELLPKVCSAKDSRAARKALTVFYMHCADRAHVAELVTLAGTISVWEPQILAYHSTGGASNGPPEAVNLIIEKTRRIGHGCRSFTNYRLRLLLAFSVTLGNYPSRTNKRTTTTLRRVEPLSAGSCCGCGHHGICALRHLSA
jgi:hypothetical protein